jgi:hypothetical protein
VGFGDASGGWAFPGVNKGVSREFVGNVFHGGTGGGIRKRIVASNRVTRHTCGGWCIHTIFRPPKAGKKNRDQRSRSSTSAVLDGAGRKTGLGRFGNIKVKCNRV